MTHFVEVVEDDGELYVERFVCEAAPDAVLASIDGALADAEFPDAMRWSPEPETVDDAPVPYDGDLVWQPPQRYEPGDWVREYDRDHPIPWMTTRRGGIRYGQTPDLVIVDDPIEFPTRVVESPAGPLVGYGCAIRPIEWRPLAMPEAIALALQAEQSAEEYEQALQRLRAALDSVIPW